MCARRQRSNYHRSGSKVCTNGFSFAPLAHCHKQFPPRVTLLGKIVCRLIRIPVQFDCFFLSTLDVRVSLKAALIFSRKTTLRRRRFAFGKKYRQKHRQKYQQHIETRKFRNHLALQISCSIFLASQLFFFQHILCYTDGAAPPVL